MFVQVRRGGGTNLGILTDVARPPLPVVPTLGRRRLRELSAASIRAWHKHLVDSGLGPSTVAKAYRLLRTILGTAVDDGLLSRNPCRLKGAATEHPIERPLLALGDVAQLAEAIEPRYRLLVWLAVFGYLRWGELMGLRTTDLDEGDSTSMTFGTPETISPPSPAHLPENSWGEWVTQVGKPLCSTSTGPPTVTPRSPESWTKCSQIRLHASRS